MEKGEPYRDPVDVRGPLCPRCCSTMSVDGPVAVCPDCRSSFRSIESMAQLLASAEEVESQLASVRGDRNTLAVPTEPKCPSCTKVMTRRARYLATAEEVHVCREHGVWVDAAVLRRILRMRRRAQTRGIKPSVLTAQTKAIVMWVMLLAMFGGIWWFARRP